MRFEVKKDESEARWQEFATVEIEELADIDQESLAMNPFRTGRAIEPVGPIQMVRAAAYPASVVGRRIIPR